MVTTPQIPSGPRLLTHFPPVCSENVSRQGIAHTRQVFDSFSEFFWPKTRIRSSSSLRPCNVGRVQNLFCRSTKSVQNTFKSFGISALFKAYFCSQNFS